jgi:CheY-like chemotaxis protein
VGGASSMHDALDKFAQFNPHVVLSDIGMPEHDGYEFIVALRKLPGGKTVTERARCALGFNCIWRSRWISTS